MRCGERAQRPRLECNINNMGIGYLIQFFITNNEQEASVEWNRWPSELISESLPPDSQKIADFWDESPIKLISARTLNLIPS